MTDKEIIEIDGINVLECEHYQYKSLKDCEMRYPESGDCEIGLLNYLFDGNLDMEKSCKDNPNCDFKQLARKTQECEELKERLERIEEDLKYQCVDCMNVKSDRYLKALEEIEEYINQYEMLGKLNIKYILDIINKAKGEGNANSGIITISCTVTCCSSRNATRVHKGAKSN